MKKTSVILFIASAFILLSTFLKAQNTFPSTGSAGIGTTSPNASSLLEMKSTTQGVLIPRMTKAQRDAVASPSQGLMVYVTDKKPGIYYYEGGWTALKGANTALSNLAAPTSIGVALLPNAPSTLDFGSQTLSWRNGFFGGAVQVGLASGTPTTGMIQWNGSDFQGYNGGSWISLTGGGSSAWALTGTNMYNTNTGSVTIGTVNINGQNKLQIGSPDDPFDPTFTGNDIAIYNADGINGMSLFASPTSSYWYTTGNFALMPAGGSGNLGIGTASASYKLTVQTGDASFGMMHTNGTVNVGTYVGSGGGWLATQSFSPLYFCTGLLNGNGSAQMALLTSGNFGIGTTNPGTKLTVQTGDASYGIIHTNGTVSVGTYVGSNGGWFGTKSNHPLYFFTNNSNALMTIATNGNVGIGTINPTYKLAVLGTIRATEVRVETGWSDFVFADNYKLRSLDDVEKFIQQNKHLPDVPSAEEIQKNGLAVGEEQTKMMQKIEELTLYVIQLQKEIDQLKTDKQ